MNDTLIQIEKDLHKTLEFVHDWMIKHKKTLVVAESCTGGRIASLLTAIPGASQYFLGSAVVYSMEMKQKVLGIPASTLKTYGTVSQETVEAMAEGALKMIKADFALAITGIAGPNTEGNIPVGTVWMTVQEREKNPVTWKASFSGDREAILKLAAKELLTRFKKQLVSAKLSI